MRNLLPKAETTVKCTRKALLVLEKGVWLFANNRKHISVAD